MSPPGFSGVLCAALVCICSCGPNRPPFELATVQPDRPRVGQAVMRDLEGSGAARVLVAFALPPTLAGVGSSSAPFSAHRDTLEAAVSRITDEILADGANAELQLHRRFRYVNAFAATIGHAGLAAIAAHRSVLRIDADPGGTGHLAEALPLVGLTDVHAAGYTGSGQTVAVIDSGVTAAHADLSGSLIDEACFCAVGAGCCPGGGSTQTGAGAAADDHGHGTHVAGILVSGGTIAPVGGAPDAALVAVKVLDANNSFCCASDVIAALDWVLANHPEVRVINASLGSNDLFTGACDNDRASTIAYATALANLRANGTLVFVSAGNDGSSTSTTAPACVADAISVGAVWDADVGPRVALGCLDATTAADQITCFSNSDSTVDLFAPGAPMISTGIGGTTSLFYGTSMASPVAAACATTLIEADPTLSPAEVENLLETYGQVINDSRNGLNFPRIACADALATLIPADGDGDGIPDASDNCPAVANQNQDNADGDADGDACDICPYDADDDSDGDGICGDIDNCPAVANQNQDNADGDADGDACDVCPYDADDDSDGDGICGDTDNCPSVSNSDQNDDDRDGTGDACDACPTDADNDRDGDGVCGDIDNCVATANSDQADSDSDGIGDACETPSAGCSCAAGDYTNRDSVGIVAFALLLARHRRRQRRRPGVSDRVI